MGLQWMWFAVFATVVVRATELIDEEYYQMPRLFELDDWDACVARRGAFCLGTFDLLPYQNDELLTRIQRFSEDKYHFNHSRLHRGYCVTSRCGHVVASSLRGRFSACVDNITRSQYGLETNLTQLQYCRSARRAARPRAAPALHAAVAGALALLALANLLGTAYDVLRRADTKPNKYLIMWSVRVNWARLTATYVDGDPRLAALKPVHGKVLTLLLVMLAHSVLAHYITYIYNPLFLEKSSHHPLSAYFQNGTSIVQTFILVSSFLLAYNLLLHADSAPERQLSLKMLPKCLLHRISRILPVYALVVGVAATWWPLASDGPLWAPLVGGECSRCRDKWWTQLLFINNLVRPDVKCLIHTWYLAVDMQLHVVCAALTLALGGRGRARAAPWILAGLFCLSVLSNFLTAYFFDLRPMVTLMFPEYMRVQFEGSSSFMWLYQAPWDSLPAALAGLLLAFLHHRRARQGEGRAPGDSRTFLWVYRASVPGMFLWVYLGYYMKGAAAPGVLALYAAADRPAFVALTATAMYGFFNQLDSLWWRVLSWRGWEVLSRVALPAYLVHWLHALSQLAARSHLSPVSVHEIGGHFLYTALVSYCTALPLHLLVELPAHRSLLAAFS